MKLIAERWKNETKMIHPKNIVQLFRVDMDRDDYVKYVLDSDQIVIADATTRIPVLRSKKDNDLYIIVTCNHPPAKLASQHYQIVLF